MLMADSPQFVVVYLAAMRMGAIPVPVSTMLKADGVAELLQDSRARFLAVTREFAATAAGAAAQAPELAGILADEALTWGDAERGDADRGDADRGGPAGSPVPVHLLGALAAGPQRRGVYPTTADSPAFWLYTSGTTGRPRRRCTGTERSRWSARPMASRSSRSAPATGACPPPKRSSPTAWVTRCCSRCRWAPARSWSGPRPGPASSRTRPRNTARPCSSPGRRSSPACSGPGWPRTRWPGCGWRPGRGRRCRRRCTRGGPRTSGWTSWMASA